MTSFLTAAFSSASTLSTEAALLVEAFSSEEALLVVVLSEAACSSVVAFSVAFFYFTIKVKSSLIPQTYPW